MVLKVKFVSVLQFRLFAAAVFVVAAAAVAAAAAAVFVAAVEVVSVVVVSELAAVEAVVAVAAVEVVFVVAGETNYIFRNSTVVVEVVAVAACRTHTAVRRPGGLANQLSFYSPSKVTKATKKTTNNC